jgi:two-component system response regulator FixJ
MDSPIVYIVDDDDGMRKSLAFILTTVGLDVETFRSPSEFLATYDSQRSGCLVLDIQLPEMSGIELLQELRKRDYVNPCIIVTGHGTVPVTVCAMRYGAIDVLEKPFHHQRLIAGVREAIRCDSLARRSQRDAVDVRRRVAELTSREREIMENVVEGRLTKQIATALGISTKTVEVHRSNITRKMGVKSVAQLVKLMTTYHCNSTVRGEDPVVVVPAWPGEMITVPG